jgi:ferredoxin
MDELRKRAKELLESKTVNVIIGYGEGTGKRIRALFVEKPEEASNLIFDSRCVLNLATYVTKREIKEKGKIAIIATIPVMRSIIQLAHEFQVSDKNLQVIGMTPESKMIEFKDLNEVETHIHQFEIKLDAGYTEKLERLKNMSQADRWKFWIDELAPCFKCYACRAACPMCYCHRCTVDFNQPQWIPVPSHELGNLEWHIMRAVHLMGRCIDCDACANACPLAIPINLLNKRLIEDAKTHFGGYQPSLQGEHQMSAFKPDDKENFIR